MASDRLKVLLKSSPQQMEGAVRRLASGEFKSLPSNVGRAILSDKLEAGHALVFAVVGRWLREQEELSAEPSFIALNPDFELLLEALAKRGKSSILRACPTPEAKKALIQAAKIVRMAYENHAEVQDMLAETQFAAGNEWERPEVRRSAIINVLEEWQWPEPLSRRAKQASRRRLSERRRVPQPSGRGRRRGAEGRQRRERIDRLEALFRALPNQEQIDRLLDNRMSDLLGEFAREEEISPETARRDWVAVTFRVARDVGVLTPWAMSGEQEAARRELIRVEKFRRRLDRLRTEITPPGRDSSV